MSVVSLELEFRGDRRRVDVCLGEVIDLPARAAPVRTLVIRTETGTCSRGMVEPRISWDEVLATASFLLDFERRNRKEAA